MNDNIVVKIINFNGLEYFSKLGLRSVKRDLIPIYQYFPRGMTCETDRENEIRKS